MAEELYSRNKMRCICSACKHIALFAFSIADFPSPWLDGIYARELSDCAGNTSCDVRMVMHHKLDLTVRQVRAICILSGY